MLLTSPAQGGRVDSWRKTRSPGKCPDSPQEPACQETQPEGLGRARTAGEGLHRCPASSNPGRTQHLGEREPGPPSSAGPPAPGAHPLCPLPHASSHCRAPVWCRPGPLCRGGQVCTPVTGLRAGSLSSPGKRSSASPPTQMPGQP